METWEHCVALLQAGASPTESLPALRALFEQLHSSSSNIDGDTHESGRALSIDRFERHLSVIPPPTSALHHRFSERLPPFPIGYTRVPFHAWLTLREVNDVLPWRSSSFDSEHVFDDIPAFQYLSVTPPKRKSLQCLLETESSWCSPLPQPILPPGDSESAMDASSSSPRCQVENVAPLEIVSKSFTRYTQSITQNETPPRCPSFPSMSAEEWSMILALGRQKNDLNPKVVKHLLGTILQPSFALVILQTVVPVLKHGVKSDHFIQLVDMAADAADLSQLNPIEIGELLNVYRGLDDDVFSAISQLSIIKRVNTTDISA